MLGYQEDNRVIRIGYWVKRQAGWETIGRDLRIKLKKGAPIPRAPETNSNLYQKLSDNDHSLATETTI